jgi:hypothetical protein
VAAFDADVDVVGPPELAQAVADLARRAAYAATSRPLPTGTGERDR